MSYTRSQGPKADCEPHLHRFNGDLLIKPGATNSKCISPVSNTNGAKVTLGPCTGAANQKWTFSGGAVRIHGNKCLDVTGGSFASRTKVEIRTCTANNPRQSWGYNVRSRRRGDEKRMLMFPTEMEQADFPEGQGHVPRPPERHCRRWCPGTPFAANDIIKFAYAACA